jgi:hypothetical protein
MAGAVVGDVERLIVHAPVEPGKIGEKAQRSAHFLYMKGIEQADFDIGVMRVQRGQQLVHALGAVVVEQQAHTHPALRCAIKHIEKQVARHIVVPNIVLDIERVIGRFNQRGARHKSIVRIIEQINAGILPLGLRRAQSRFQPRRGSGIHIMAHAAPLQRGQALAGGK